MCTVHKKTPYFSTLTHVPFCLTYTHTSAIIIIVEGNNTDHEEVIKMLKYNYETMRYERVDDKRPDLLADKLENDFDYGDYDTDYDY